MVVEDIFHAEKFEGEGNHENIVGRIAALDHMETAAQENPPCIEKFPKQCAAVLPQISERGVSSPRHGVPVDMDPFQHFVPLGITLTPGAQNSDFVTVLLQAAGFFPHPAVKRHWQVLNDNQNLFLHN